MKVSIIGCSGSFAGPESAASCYLVEADDGDRPWRILLDLGSGALGALQRHIDPLTLDGVFISHLHPDHCIDLTGLYVMRRYHPDRPAQDALPVWGPADTPQRAAQMYHGIDAGTLELYYSFRAVHDGAVVHFGPFTVTSFLVNHPVEAYGFRVETAEAVLAYTGDTDLCDALSPLMADADLVLADCAFVDGRDDAHPDIHLSGSRAALAATKAGGVRRLMLTHLPTWNDPQACLAQARQVAGGLDVCLARPGASHILGRRR